MFVLRGEEEEEEEESLLMSFILQVDIFATSVNVVKLICHYCAGLSDVAET